MSKCPDWRSKFRYKCFWSIDTTYIRENLDDVSHYGQPVTTSKEAPAVSFWFCVLPPPLTGLVLYFVKGVKKLSVFQIRETIHSVLFQMPAWRLEATEGCAARYKVVVWSLMFHRTFYLLNLFNPRDRYYHNSTQEETEDQKKVEFHFKTKFHTASWWWQSWSLH